MNNYRFRHDVDVPRVGAAARCGSLAGCSLVRAHKVFVYLLLVAHRHETYSSNVSTSSLFVVFNIQICTRVGTM